jgi:hypothetical protein
MSFTAQQTISLRAPQWSADPRINDFIAFAQQGLSAAVIGDRYGEAVGLKVLHMMAVEAANGGNPGTGSSGGSGGTGALASETEGDLSRSYSTGGAASGGKMLTIDDLASTQYGQELLKLLRSCVMLPRTRMM